MADSVPTVIRDRCRNTNNAPLSDTDSFRGLRFTPYASRPPGSGSGAEVVEVWRRMFWKKSSA